MGTILLKVQTDIVGQSFLKNVFCLLIGIWFEIKKNDWKKCYQDSMTYTF